MKLRGSKTEIINVEVSPEEIYEAFVDRLAQQLFPDPACRPLPVGSRNSVYIESRDGDRKGFWERWEDGHGSGYTATLRRATQSELEAYDTYMEILELREVFLKTTKG